MALEQIKDRLARLNALAERWNDTDINAIERDLALEHLRAIYDELSFYAATAPTAAAQPSATPATAPATAAGTTVAAAADNSIVEIAAEEPATLIDDPIDIDILLGLSSPEQEQTETEMETALVPTAEPEAETKVETAKPVANTDKEVVVAIAPEPEQPTEAIEPTPEPAEETAPEPEQPAEPAEEVAPEAEPEQPADETAPESIEESAPEPEIPAAETAPEPEQPAEQPARAPMGGLFDINEIPIRSKRRRNIMISLYEEPVKPLTHDDKPAPTSAQPERNEIATQVPEPTNAEPATAVVPVVQPEHEQLPEESISAAPAAETVPADDSAADNNTIIHPQPAEPEPQPQRYTAPVTPQPAPTPRLADILAGEVTTLADSMISGNHSPRTAASARIDDLRKAIGINDRFLMIRDLFNGDAQMFEDTITTLNEFDDLDECMIYIVENFAWNPDSDGAKLLMSLIERKLA